VLLDAVLTAAYPRKDLHTMPMIMINDIVLKGVRCGNLTYTLKARVPGLTGDCVEDYIAKALRIDINNDIRAGSPEFPKVKSTDIGKERYRQAKETGTLEVNLQDEYSGTSRIVTVMPETPEDAMRILVDKLGAEGAKAFITAMAAQKAA